MDGRLVKVIDDYYLINDEPRLKGDWHINMGNHNTITKLKEDGVKFADKYCKKITASTSIKMGLKILDRKNCDEIFGNINVDELAVEFVNQHKFASSHIADPTSFKAGFKKSEENNQFKIFTLQDVKKIFKLADDMHVFERMTYRQALNTALEEVQKLREIKVISFEIDNYLSLKKVERKLIKLDGKYYLTCQEQTNLCYHITHNELIEVTGVGEKSGEVFHNKGWNHPEEVWFIDTEVKLNEYNCNEIFNPSDDLNETQIVVREAVRKVSKEVRAPKVVRDGLVKKKPQVIDVEFDMLIWDSILKISPSPKFNDNGEILLKKI